MGKPALILLAAGILTAIAPAGRSGAGVDVHVNIGPPPPAVVFEHEPEVVLVPSTRVYYVPNQDYDLFRYGGYWYLDRGGYWYRASAYNGPFEAVRYETVPHAIVVVPASYHHHPVHPPHPHGGPPGHAHGHGHDHDHDHGHHD